MRKNFNELKKSKLYLCFRQITRIFLSKRTIWNFYRFKKKHKKIIIFISTPSHGNLGDHTIVYAQYRFMERIGLGDRVFEFTRWQYELCRKQIKKIIGQDDVIVIDGGGNIGTLWIEEENKMRDIIRRFPVNPIIVFPQTAYFSDDDYGRTELKKSAEIYCAHKNLTIYARDTDTDRLLSRRFPSVKTFFVPDIVLSVTDVPPAGKRDGILLCFRGDAEKVMTEESLGSIQTYLAQNHYDYRTASTLVDHRVTARTRKRELFRKWAEFSGARLIVTDRLHGMLFAAITGTPCLALDNVSHKVKQGYEWIGYLPYIKFCENSEELIGAIKRFYGMGGRLYDAEPLRKYFAQMQDEVKRTIENAEQANDI